jgi:hypothetical protein
VKSNTSNRKASVQNILLTFLLFDCHIILYRYLPDVLDLLKLRFHMFVQFISADLEIMSPCDSGSATLCLLEKKYLGTWQCSVTASSFRSRDALVSDEAKLIGTCQY